jgi:hypothetical protein
MKKAILIPSLLILIYCALALRAETISPVDVSVGVDIASTNQTCEMINLTSQELCNTLNNTEGIMFDNETQCIFTSELQNCTISPGSVKITMSNSTTQYELGTDTHTVLSYTYWVDLNKSLSVDEATIQSLFHGQLNEQNTYLQNMWTDMFKDYRTRCDEYDVCTTKLSSCEAQYEACNETRAEFKSLSEDRGTTNTYLILLLAGMAVVFIIFVLGSGRFLEKMRDRIRS